MALTVRALSPQTQLRALNNCYASFPWRQDHTKRIFSLYFKKAYYKKEMTTNSELKGKTMQCTAKVEKQHLFQFVNAAASLVTSWDKLKADQHAN